MNKLQDIIESAWQDRTLLSQPDTISSIEQVIELLDKGKKRIAEKTDSKGWVVNEWIKKAVLLYFPIRKMETFEAGPMEFHDKIPLKKDYAAQGVRVVPHAIARYGAHLYLVS